MSGSFPSPRRPATGLHETLITTGLETQLAEIIAAGRVVIRKSISDDSSAQVLTRHVADAIARALEQLEPSEQVKAANELLRHLGNLTGSNDLASVIAAGPSQLLAVAEEGAADPYRVRPTTPLSESALITNAPEEPNLGTELRAELATADHIDLLCAFVKWTGLRVLDQQLRAAADRGVPIRVITTTYIGATERGALDRLVRDFNAEVKVNYEVRSTRLHAKAWLFRRRSDFNTAYVGSSNLSRAALLDGLEWNVRLSSVSTPAPMQKFESTFESYWAHHAFEPYDPDRDGDRLDKALQAARGIDSGNRQAAYNISHAGEIDPHPYQRDMLDRLEAERILHDRHQNLLVAATGTGKTVMAALDFKQLRKRLGHNLRLLFVAHRREILDQSRRTYRRILNDGAFGELFIGGESSIERRHVFASVQSLHTRTLDKISPTYFDVIVIDEFHHGTSDTYRKILDHFEPTEFLGLTATPERADGLVIQDEFFDGKISAEMRLWEALENDLLSPFHYFGITDETDMRAIAWKRGGYDVSALSELFTDNEKRAELVRNALQDKHSNPDEMRALGFCVSVKHAHFMADFFVRSGYRAVALSGNTPEPERRTALEDLREGRLHVIFSVDLLNEGLDIPDVDTLLLLRPTSSATVFLQQLGRGLRRSASKPVLTVLDFIGQHRKEFRFEEQFRALTNLTGKRLLTSIRDDFPLLPSGCEIILEPKSKELIIGNIQEQLKANVTKLAKEVATYGTRNLAEYLKESGRDIQDVYRGGKGSWTYLLHQAKLITSPAHLDEAELLKRVPAFLHVDDPKRFRAYTDLLSDDAPLYEQLDTEQQAFARMFFFSLWPLGGTFTTYQDGLNAIRAHRDFRDELRQVLAYTFQQADHLPIHMTGHPSDFPLTIHSSYSREEILPALGISKLDGFLPGHFQEGARWCPEINSDALFVTLDKQEKDFSPQTRFKDYAMSESTFHWESQNRTSETSATGMRYQSHKNRGSHVLLFVRRYKTNDIGRPYPSIFLGPADYIRHEGSGPMAIEWRLHHPLPADVWSYSTPAG
ncbi:DUF3427 domain-containing protein [Streptomyces sp. NPDC006529]|uniref:DUF3427 domain-containing protein n=1 Tax=Streptomyces sp. NPDC006529 TaxID=3157177 RepID=UPI0033B8AFFB